VKKKNKNNSSQKSNCEKLNGQEQRRASSVVSAIKRLNTRTGWLVQHKVWIALAL